MSSSLTTYLARHSHLVFDDFLFCCHLDTLSASLQFTSGVRLNLDHFTKGQFLNAWKIDRGKRSLAHRDIWDARRRCWRKTGIFFTPVKLPKLDHPLWLVVSAWQIHSKLCQAAPMFRL